MQLIINGELGSLQTKWGLPRFHLVPVKVGMEV